MQRSGHLEYARDSMISSQSQPQHQGRSYAVAVDDIRSDLVDEPPYVRNYSGHSSEIADRQTAVHVMQNGASFLPGRYGGPGTVPQPHVDLDAVPDECSTLPHSPKRAYGCFADL